MFICTLVLSSLQSFADMSPKERIVNAIENPESIDILKTAVDHLRPNDLNDTTVFKYLTHLITYSNHFDVFDMIKNPDQGYYKLSRDHAWEDASSYIRQKARTLIIEYLKRKGLTKAARELAVDVIDKPAVSLTFETPYFVQSVEERYGALSFKEKAMFLKFMAEQMDMAQSLDERLRKRVDLQKRFQDSHQYLLQRVTEDINSGPKSNDLMAHGVGLLDSTITTTAIRASSTSYKNLLDHESQAIRSWAANLLGNKFIHSSEHETEEIADLLFSALYSKNKDVSDIAYRTLVSPRGLKRLFMLYMRRPMDNEGYRQVIRSHSSSNGPYTDPLLERSHYLDDVLTTLKKRNPTLLRENIDKSIDRTAPIALGEPARSYQIYRLFAEFPERSIGYISSFILVGNPEYTYAPLIDLCREIKIEQTQHLAIHLRHLIDEHGAYFNSPGKLSLIFKELESVYRNTTPEDFRDVLAKISTTMEQRNNIGHNRLMMFYSFLNKLEPKLSAIPPKVVIASTLDNQLEQIRQLQSSTADNSEAIQTKVSSIIESFKKYGVVTSNIYIKEDIEVQIQFIRYVRDFSEETDPVKLANLTREYAKTRSHVFIDRDLLLVAKEFESYFTNANSFEDISNARGHVNHAGIRFIEGDRQTLSFILGHLNRDITNPTVFNDVFDFLDREGIGYTDIDLNLKICDYLENTLPFKDEFARHKDEWVRVINRHFDFLKAIDYKGHYNEVRSSKVSRSISRIEKAFKELGVSPYVLTSLKEVKTMIFDATYALPLRFANRCLEALNVLGHKISNGVK